jgi:uncharacterized C2H2 Zn-finger protein
MTIADTIKSIISKPLEILQRKREIKKEHVEEYHRKTRLRCPDCGGIFNSRADYEKHWHEVHSNVEKSFGKAYKKVVHEEIPALIPENVRRSTPPIVKKAVKKSVATSEKASSAAYRRFKKGPLASDRSNVICPNCNRSYPYDAYGCPYCHEPNPYQSAGYLEELEREKKSLRSSSREKVDTDIYLILMVEIAGIASIFLPTILGFPISFIYLAAALMAVLPIYILFPGESEIIKSLGPNEPMGSKGWLLIPKAFFKILFFILVIYQFFLINLMITLVIAFFFYFSLDIEFKNSEPYKMIESFFRMALGFFIAYLFYVTFGTISVGFSLAVMTLAFFATLPVYKKEKSEGKWVIQISDKIKDVGGGFEKVDRYAWFPILMIISLLSSGILLSWTGDITQIMFILIWIMSLVTGISAGSGGRPAIGVLMIIIALFTFSSMYTGQIGQAVFGYYWPQVQSLTETVFEPLSEMWYQAQSSMSDAWLMITNPQQYYLIQQQKYQATKSVVKSGGTIKSIELSKFDLFTTATGFLEPQEDPLVGSIELHNEGEFEADNIALNIIGSWEDPVDPTITMTFDNFMRFECSTPYTSNSPPLCNWGSTTYPNEIRLASFAFDKGSGTWGTLTDIESTDEGDVYVHGGETVKITADYEYNYNVNVSLPVEIIDWNRYFDLLQAREIILQEVTSQYTGGPVKATIWSQKQPIRSPESGGQAESSLFVASLYNEGRGNITTVQSFTIKIPTDMVNSTDDIEVLGSTFYGSDGLSDSNCPITTEGDYYVITCEHRWADHPIKPGEYKRVSFFIDPKTISVDRINRLLIGSAKYRYAMTNSKSLTIVNQPPQ